MYKSTIVITALSIFLGIHTTAQVPVNVNKNLFLLPADSQKLLIHVGNKNFFKNNEYFSPLEEGLTLPGVIFEPSISYHPGTNLSIDAGASLLKYFGRGGIYLVEPVFRFQYRPAPFLQMIMGTLYGGTRHGLIEPLYQWERTFTHPVENGLQFLFKTPKLNTDVWLEWRKFIMKNDPFQEELLFGTTFSYKLLPTDRSFNVSIPFQTTINHHGGQIDTTKVPLRTIFNCASGLNFSWLFEGAFIKQIDLDCWGIGYKDFSPDKQQRYTQGFATYPQAKMYVSNFFFQAGYFHGEGYMNSLGEPLYFSATIDDNAVYSNTIRDMITCKLVYSKQIHKGILLSAYFELYKDMYIARADYDYGIHIVFDQDFFVTRIR
jgi:hypothetical protein